MELGLLISWPLDREIILGCLAGPCVIMASFKVQEGRTLKEEESRQKNWVLGPRERTFFGMFPVQKEGLRCWTEGVRERSNEMKPEWEVEEVHESLEGHHRGPGFTLQAVDCDKCLSRGIIQYDNELVFYNLLGTSQGAQASTKFSTEVIISYISLSQCTEIHQVTHPEA